MREREREKERERQRKTAVISAQWVRPMALSVQLSSVRRPPPRVAETEQRGRAKWRRRATEKKGGEREREGKRKGEKKHAGSFLFLSLSLSVVFLFSPSPARQALLPVNASAGEQRTLAAVEATGRRRSADAEQARPLH